MPKHVAVSPLEHKDIRISNERSEWMGDGMMCCVTFPEEFRNVQAHYPILFQHQDAESAFRCLAVFGFENGENLFLKDGKWDARYMPLAMDIMPFMIGMPKDGTEEKKVVLDLDNPRVNKDDGMRLFDENGMASVYLENISKKLGYLDDGFKRSGKYIDALKKYDLLEPLSIDVTLRDGSKNRLEGFHTIHEEKFKALDGKALDDLKSQGYLLPTYMMLASLSNLAQLIDRKESLDVNAS